MKEALVVAVFVAAYVLIATEWVHRVVVALAGAGLVLLFRLTTAADAFQSHRYGIDWNVIFLLFGMMVIVGVLMQTGLFEFLAIWSAKLARGRPFRVLLMLVLITAVASALLDNVTTVLLVAPVTLLLAERLGVSPIPYLIAIAMASNIGGTATLVGDPPNIIIGSQAGLSYLDFLVNLGPLVVILLVVFALLARFMFRVTYHPERVRDVMALDPRESLRELPLLWRALGVLAVVTVAFALHGLLHYEPSVVALLGAGTLLLIAGREPTSFLREVEWKTLLFFAGLFVMVGALVRVGVVDEMARAISRATSGDVFLSAILLVWVSAIASAFVDNIPYVATMAPLVHDLVSLLPQEQGPRVLWWALAIGADLGGNATIVGASANVVVLGLAGKSGHQIRFAEFARYGVVVVVVTLLVSSAYLWLRYFA